MVVLDLLYGQLTCRGYCFVTDIGFLLSYNLVSANTGLEMLLQTSCR